MMNRSLIKTPIGILEEYCSKKHLERPKYSIVAQVDGTFNCIAHCLNKTVTGQGNNKKGAKQNAAEKILQLILAVDEYSKEITPIESDALQPIDSANILIDYCIEFDIQSPIYKFEVDGPPFFIVRVVIEHLHATGKAETLPVAHEIAAKNMLQMIVTNKEYLLKENLTEWEKRK